MPEYTHKDVIIDPTSEEAKNCIGKMAYHADSPSQCLSFAKGGGSNHCGILKETKPYMDRPFMFNTEWGCIIPKKEDPKPEYIPFSNPDEFIDAYISNLDKRMDIGAIHKLDKFGMWIKYKDEYVLITYIEQSGINSGTEFASDWQDVYYNYTFLDGTPCGKIKE